MADQLTSRTPSPLQETYTRIRQQTLCLVADLSDADTTVQSMDDASPAKWHLAHTSWFFETFVLLPGVAGYTLFNPSYNFLFNSYYEAVGPRHPRPSRGMLTRPSLEEVIAYREYVDQAMQTLLEAGAPDELCSLTQLGLNHEQQHQELLLTDILHMFAQNPLRPAYRQPAPAEVPRPTETKTAWQAFDGGLQLVGHDGNGFSFDCETPAHEFLLQPFQLASRAVTNADWLAFMDDGGYDRAALWLADGWEARQQNCWSAPLYWEKLDDAWHTMTLRGMQPVDLSAPVCHVSFFEADAFATWAGARLPTEQEWEAAAGRQSIRGNFVESGFLRPRPQDGAGLCGLFGDVWEWTQSPFTAYPGFKISEGAVGEYNGKFMSGQMVLRGGSCVTPADHLRATYRNFFHPQKRWQFAGLRLARDC